MLDPEIAVNRRPIDRLNRNSRIGTFLHGSVLGHPLHAVITDVPVGLGR